MKNIAITTTDNPFNPLKQFEEWNAFDEGKGYHSCSFLARLCRDSEQLTDEENQEELERAIDEMVKYDLIAYETNNQVHYKKVVEETANTNQ